MKEAPEKANFTGSGLSHYTLLHFLLVIMLIPLLVVIMPILLLMPLLLGVAKPNREGTLEGRVSEGACFGEGVLEGQG